MATVLIAGGGIAGLATALAMSRDGWQAQIFEQADALGEVGAGLQLSPNACKALAHLGVLEAVRASAFAPSNAVLRDGASGAEIYRAALGPAAEERWHAPYLHVHRADLHDALLQAAVAAGVAFETGALAERAVERPEGIAFHLEGGRIVEGDLAIGADGIHSRLRAAMNPDEMPRFTGQVAWRALVRASALPEGTVSPDATVWAGPGQHLVSYYVRGGELVNLVAVREQPEWAEEGWRVPGNAGQLRAAFAGWHADVEALLDGIDTCFLWGLFDRPEQVRWTKGRLALVGDAAHPMLPFMAQGAAQALEDAVTLVRHLKASDLPGALEAWEDERFARVTRVLQASRANGRLFHQRPGPVRALRRSVISGVSNVAPGLAAGRLDWLYGFDPVTG